MECVIEERASFCSSRVSERRSMASQRPESCVRWEAGEMIGGGLLMELFLAFFVGGVRT